MRQTVFFTIIYLLFTLSGFAQDEIPKNKEDYFKFAESLVKDGDSDAAKYLDKDYKSFFFDAKIDEQRCAYLYDATEELNKKRMLRYPYIFQLLEGFRALETQALGTDVSAASDAFLAGTQLRSKSDVENFLTTIAGLGTDGTFAQGTSLAWRFKSGSLQLRSDNGEINLELTDAELIIATKGDSSNIYRAEGFYSIKDNRLELNSGRISWEKAGLAKAGNYADFYNASIRCKSSFFDLDSAQVTSEFLPEPKWGKVKEKLSTAGTGRSRYPSFESGSGKLLIENILPNVNYYGGFALRGSSLEGFNSPDNPGKLEFFNGDLLAATVTASNFEIDTAKISAVPAEISLKLGDEDSLYHPGLSFKYFNADKKLELIRYNEGVGEAPFYSSYHNMDMYVQRITWVTNQPMVDFGSLEGEASKRASFESDNFFEMARYKALTGYGGDGFRALERCSKQFGTEFNLETYGRFANMSEVDAIRNLIGFANKGFIYYNIYTKKVQVKQKFFAFMEAANDKRDYDNIFFVSNAPKGSLINAQLSLDSFNLDILGVRKVPLSDSQSVAMFANKGDEKLSIKKNLDMQFEGVVTAGNLDFYGDSIFFSYDSFSIDLNMVDSVKVVILDSNNKYIKVRTAIENMQGMLAIDKPDNKRGKGAYKSNFPILTSTNNAYVYYDKPQINGGVYKRDDFYFKILPFEMDSLDDQSKESIHFKGVMVTGGIFPDISDSLVVMDDFSLGINYSTPKEGLALYDDKTIFTENIKMTETGGLQGKGSLKYVTSFSSSKRFNFYPDSTFGVAQSFENSLSLASPSTPDVTGQDFQFFLSKSDDYMTATSIKNDFVAYNGQALLQGQMRLNQEEMLHAGTMEMYNGTATSKKIRLAANVASAQKTAFKLYERNSKELALATNDVKMSINFDSKLGEFIANDLSTSKVEFPKNEYVAFMDKYLWQIEDQKIEMTSSVQATEDENSLASNLLSVQKDQDSLRFVAPKAIYDINEYTIRAEQVKRIRTGDAFVEPDEGKVNILANARIEALQKAVIIADAVNQFHRIFDATVEIIGRKKYLGRGKYDYIDEFDKKQQIAFEDIAVVDGQTVAEGSIPDEQNFKLNAFFDFRGKAKLFAQEKGLSFAGSTRIKSNCSNIPNNWLAFEGQVDPKNAKIPVTEQMQTDSGQALSVGLTINESTNELYPAFLSAKSSQKDRSLIAATGFLWYDDASKSYKVGSEQRYNKEAVGNVIALNTESCQLKAEGLHSFGLDLGQLDATVYGSSSYESKSGKASLQGAVKLDFFFDDKMLEFIAEDFQANPFLQSFDIGATNYLDGLQAWLPEKDAKVLREEYNSSGKIDKYPKSLASVPFIFADVKFEWNESELSFVSKGALQLASVGNKQPFASVKGDLRLRKIKSGNDVNLYFEISSDAWYYFRYKLDSDPKMETTSTNEAYTTRLGELKDNEKVLKTKRDEATYRFTDASKQQKDVFLENLR